VAVETLIKVKLQRSLY